MSPDSFVKRVNSLASSKTPFFFLIDFEKKEPLVFSLEEAFEQQILFNVGGYSNYVQPSVSKKSYRINAKTFFC